MIAKIIENFGKSPLCNGISERAWHIGSFVFPLCFRCMAICLGLIVTLVFLLIRNYSFINKFKISIISFFMIIPTTVDGLLQTFFEITSNNYRRFFTGLLAGIGVGMLLYMIINLIFKKFSISYKKSKSLEQ